MDTLLLVSTAQLASRLSVVLGRALITGIDFFEGARQWYLRLLLDNLRAVASQFLDNRSTWHTRDGGWLDRTGPADGAWLGNDPPHTLLDYTNNYNAYPYHLGSRKFSKIDWFSTARWETSVTEVIKTVTHLSWGPSLSDAKAGKHSWGRKKRTKHAKRDIDAWTHSSLYCKDPGETLLHFDKVVQHALWHASRLVDKGACLKHARSQHACKEGCERYPCVKAQPELYKSSLQEWEAWPMEVDYLDQEGEEEWYDGKLWRFVAANNIS